MGPTYYVSDPLLWCENWIVTQTTLDVPHSLNIKENSFGFGTMYTEITISPMVFQLFSYPFSLFILGSPLLNTDRYLHICRSITTGLSSLFHWSIYSSMINLDKWLHMKNDEKTSSSSEVSSLFLVILGPSLFHLNFKTRLLYIRTKVIWLTWWF